ncbi:UDP-N-acetylglucosamine 1-carboxyvinyltransferase, partial [Patescibacteria group bacterium]|nr:UDP-N-acetylglucosamine 1-carboxyvinyltransferase [Patescibacteria group bacterium]
FPWISHTATESFILAATLAEGTTELINVACEPEVEALCRFLNGLGAKISGGGTNRIIISGVSKLSGGEFAVIPDRIEAGTFAIMGGLLAKELKINKCNPEHLEVLFAHLDKVGVPYQREKETIIVKKSDNLRATQIRTHEYPGFVTDLQAPFTVLLTQAQGVSLVHEVIYEGRLFYTDKLIKMGAKVTMCDPHRVIIEGPTKLYACEMESPDIRAGIALIIAAMLAEGQSEISNIYQVDRGYQNIAERLSKIGAKIKRNN